MLRLLKMFNFMLVYLVFVCGCGTVGVIPWLYNVWMVVVMLAVVAMFA